MDELRRQRRRRLHAEQHVPVKSRAGLHHLPSKGLLLRVPLRHWQYRCRSGRGLRPLALPRRRERHHLRQVPRGRVPGRAAAVRVQQGGVHLLRPLLSPILQLELPCRHRQRPRQDGERERSSRGVRRGRGHAPQRNSGPRGGGPDQAIRHGRRGVRRERPRDIRAGTVHTGHVTGGLPELPGEYNSDGAQSIQREPEREVYQGALQLSLRAVPLLLRQPAAAAPSAGVASATATPTGASASELYVSGKRTR